MVARFQRPYCRLWRQVFALLTLTLFLGLGATESAEVLDAKSLQNLLAGGPEGTTILLRGGADRLFYSPSLKNSARQSKDLGIEFLRKHVRADTVTEGVFIARFFSKDQPRVISGVAGIAADKGTGQGVLYLVETFTTDRTIAAFSSKDRLYSVLVIADGSEGLTCRHSQWEKLLSFKGQLRFEQVPCEFQVGNLVLPAEVR